MSKEKSEIAPTVQRHGTMRTSAIVQLNTVTFLREQGAPALLARERVLSVIAQMSSKDHKHAQCANFLD